MSLTRRMLKAMGIEEDTIEQIIEAHTETTDSLKAERDRYKEQAEKAAELEGELEEANRQLQEADSAAAEYEKLKGEYDKEHKKLEELRESSKTLQAEFDTYKGDVEAKETKRKKTGEYKKLLEKAGIAQKYLDKVLRVTKLEDIEFDEDGSVKDADKAVEGIKTEWAEFIPTTQVKGSDPENPPKPQKTVEGANPRAVQIAKERHERLYGKSEE